MDIRYKTKGNSITEVLDKLVIVLNRHVFMNPMARWVYKAPLFYQVLYENRCWDIKLYQKYDEETDSLLWVAQFKR